MKKLAIFLFGLSVTIISYADNAAVAAIITIENKTVTPIELAGSSLGCGSSAQAENTMKCGVDGKIYYDFTRPPLKIMPKMSGRGSVISFKKDAYARLGLQYSRFNISRLVCGLVMDFVGDNITNIQVNPSIPGQPMACAYERNGKNIRVILSDS